MLLTISNGKRHCITNQQLVILAEIYKPNFTVKKLYQRRVWQGGLRD